MRTIAPLLRSANRLSSLTVACALLTVLLLLLPGRVFAEAPITAGPYLASPWRTQQQAIVEVEVWVRTMADVALLRQLGYSCPVGSCVLELPAGGEEELAALGLPVQVLAHAIKASASAEGNVYGENQANYIIPDAPGDGSTGKSPIDISGAPTGAKVTKIVYSLCIYHPMVSELSAWLLGAHLDHFWYLQGGTTDLGEDDDTADDNDIEIYARVADTVFDGETVNKQWKLIAGDIMSGNHGFIDWWHLYVYFDCALLMPGTPAVPSPVDSAKDQSLDVNLNWADAELADSYDLYFGATYPPPYLTNVTSSSYDLSRLQCDTHYRWKIVSRNACGTTVGQIWDFTTACCLPAAPACPTPEDGATGLPLDVNLDWVDVSSATSYDVYFGTSPSPPFVLNTVTSSFDPGTLSYGTHYYWKVVTRNDCGTTTGPVWDLTTLNAPTATPTRTPTVTNTPTRTATGAPTVTLTRTPAPTATGNGVHLGLYLPLLRR